VHKVELFALLGEQRRRLPGLIAEAHAAGIQTIGLGVGTKVKVEDIEIMASAPKSINAFYTSDFSQMNSFVLTISANLCNTLRCAPVEWSPEGGTMPAE